jgi:ATP-dependent Clp protease ATP-binding subunit ClpC
MFERYDEHARRAVFFARYAASQSGSPTLEPEHLLLGLIREASPLFARLAPSVSLEELRERIPRRIVVENPSVRMHMPLSKESKRILGYSAEEANDLDHRYIGAEHLLLGVLRENTCMAARLLSEMGVQAEQLRQNLARGTSWTGAADSCAPPVEVDRESIHALVDKLPDAMLVQVKEIVDRMLWKSERERPPQDTASMVVKGTFSS